MKSVGVGGCGSVSVGKISIYYPAGTIGTIIVSSGKSVIKKLPADGSGMYEGDLEELTAKTYKLTLSGADSIFAGELAIVP